MVKEREEIDELERLNIQFKKLSLYVDGICEFCFQVTLGWHPIVTDHGKQVLMDQGINYITGHKLNCSHK